jgi:hypothetical protein
MDATDPKSGALARLFEEAQKKSGIQYVYSLVRVSGLNFRDIDPLVELESCLQHLKEKQGSGDEEALLSLLANHEPYKLLINLLNCALGGNYDCDPFRSFRSGQYPNISQPKITQVISHVKQRAMESGRPDIGELLGQAYPESVIGKIAENQSLPTEDIRQTLADCSNFLGLLLAQYKASRLKFKNGQTLYKLPHFDVLELLLNDDEGLYGFKVYFSNGNSAFFIRRQNATDGSNYDLDVPIGFQVGNIDQLRHEWRVGKKWLYEHEKGLPGRYNALGEWKPLIYPGKSDSLQKEARQLSDDPEVQGSIFYMMCTGHRVIEFVVKATIELPIPYVRFGDQLHFHKCTPRQDTPSSSEWIYDGWIELEEVDPNAIKQAIAMINIAVNRLAFSYGGSVQWRLKYSTLASGGGCATPNQNDLEMLNSMLIKFPSSEDAVILDSALDWFNRGRASRNIFTSFLCYYISLESVAVAIADGEGDFGLTVSNVTKSEQDKTRHNCIEEKYKALYKSNPIQFVVDAYFDCVQGLKRKTRLVSELVFGPGHDAIAALFEAGKDGESLSDIRSQLAHGRLSLADRQHEHLVRKRVHEIAEIARAFLMRLIFRLRPGDKLPAWSGLHQMHMTTSDPRNTLVASCLDIFPLKDWSIKTHWCD